MRKALLIRLVLTVAILALPQALASRMSRVDQTVIAGGLGAQSVLQGDGGAEIDPAG